MADNFNQAETDLVFMQDHFEFMEKTKDIVDQLIDVILNYRQSGHPGGSRSKVHMLLSLMLSGAMRWDIRHPEKRFADRFILSAGHTIPLVYCTLAVLDEALRIKFAQTGDKAYRMQDAEKNMLVWEDLLRIPPSGRAFRACRNDRQILIHKIQHRPVRPRQPGRCG